MRPYFWVMAGCGTALLLALASPASAADKIVARWNAAEPETLDPQRSTSASDDQVEQDLFEGLTRATVDGKILPGIADSWTVSPDGLTYSFHLRGDAKWSNGDPVTSADFLYSFRRLVTPETGAAYIDPLQNVINAEAIVAGKVADPAALGVEAPSPSSLVLHLVRPEHSLLLLLSGRATYPLPRATIEKFGHEWTRPGNIVGDGPFTLRSWVPHDQIVLDKSQTYYGKDEIKIDAVRHIVVDNESTGFLRWQAGELDIAQPPAKEIPTLDARFGARVHHGRSRSVSYASINMGRAPLGTDHRLREAMNLAIDREVLVTKVLTRGEKPAYSFVPPVMSDYTPQRLPFQEMSMADRVARAKQLMAEAGYGPDHPLAIEVTFSTNEEVRTLAAALQQMWAPIGIKATLTNEEFQVYMETINHKAHQVGLLNFVDDIDDAEQFLHIYRTNGGDFNDAGFADKEFDADLAAAAGTVDPVARRAALEAAERRLMAEMPVLPLSYGTTTMLVSDRIQGWIDNDAGTASRYLSIKD
ncbi:MAG TPA: peptide ABC transporter substrate-binding protein [Aliidongia sp.]|nr:peptide ABC transporter substrate-binding protein [Aliidongia sp.]